MTRIKSRIFSTPVTVFLSIILMIILMPVTVAAEMLDKYAEPAPVASSGSFVASLNTQLDFALSGGELTGAKWSLAYLNAGYSLTGTIKEGEAVSLSVTGTQPSGIGDQLVFNSLTVALYFRDEANRDVVEAQKYSSGNIKKSPLSHQLGGTVPAGTKRVVITGVFNSRWTAGMAVVAEGVSVSVELIVESGKTTAALPVVTATPLKTPTKTSPAPSQATPAGGGDEEAKSSPGDDKGSLDGFSPWDSPWENPWEHAGVAPTIYIAIAAALVAVLGGAIGSAAGGAAAGAAAGSAAGAAGSAAGAAAAGGTGAGGLATSATATAGAGAGAGAGAQGMPAGAPPPDAAESGAQAGDTSGRDPAYERSKVPDYPGFTTGADGERISRMPNGNIEVSYTGGERAVHFPNGTVQIKNPDGTTWEEWPDGTVSSSDDEGFYVKKTDGTLSHVKPNGEEMIYNPDGTSTETTVEGMKITRNEAGNVVTVEGKDGAIGTRHPEEPDAVVVSYPNGNKLTVRTKQKWVTRRNEEGKMESELVDHHVFEGEIRTEDMTITYKPDGSAEGRGDDGSVVSRDSEGNIKCKAADGSTYEEYTNGSVDYKGADGSHFKSDSQTGEIDGVTAEGGYIKGNLVTKELDAKLPDGSYWKRDAQGNGSFVDKEAGARGDYRSDGHSRIDNANESIVHEADGTMEYKTTTGVTVSEKPDGTVSTQLPDGRSSLDTPDGTKTINMPDGTVFQKTPDGLMQIRRADGNVQNYSGEDFEKELSRYNDWYNKQLGNNLKNQG